MATTGTVLINQHPTNPVQETFYHSSSNKAWAQSFPPITKFNICTSVREPQSVVANFTDAFLEEYDDDILRLTEPVNRPNYRQWRLNSEEDGINWFHTEVSNIVLSAWARYPPLLQVSHEKPLSEENHTQTVDVAYSVSNGQQRTHVAIGEFKRCLLIPRQWQNGSLTTTQRTLSQELRG